jgi:cytochrome c556
MMRSFFVCASLAVGATAVIAQADVITERKQIMRGNGAATRTGTQMIRNEVPFDVAKAREVFSGIAAGMDRFPTLFPEGSQSGSQPTRAGPTIWSDNAGFRAAAAKIVQEAQQAVASTTDLASFQANFQRVTANCNVCHDKYRTPQ